MGWISATLTSAATWGPAPPPITATFDAVTAPRGPGQCERLFPVDLVNAGDFDPVAFVLRVSDEAPLYVYNPAPLRVPTMPVGKPV
jgi:hypothetical protein